MWTKNSIKYILSSILSEQKSRVRSRISSNCPMSWSSYQIRCDAKGTQTICQMWCPWSSSRVCFDRIRDSWLWFIFSPEAGDNDISVGRCGSIRDKKWKMTIGDNVSMNCNGSRCFPGCKDPSKVSCLMNFITHRSWLIAYHRWMKMTYFKSPTTPVLECVKRGRRSTMTPFFANTQCVGESYIMSNACWLMSHVTHISINNLLR